MLKDEKFILKVESTPDLSFQDGEYYLYQVGPSTICLNTDRSLIDQLIEAVEEHFGDRELNGAAYVTIQYDADALVYEVIGESATDPTKQGRENND